MKIWYIDARNSGCSVKVWDRTICDALAALLMSGPVHPRWKEEGHTAPYTMAMYSSRPGVVAVWLLIFRWGCNSEVASELC